MAAATSAGPIIAPVRSSASTKAISASILGCSVRAASIGVPGAHAMLSKSTPKSGRSTPNCACTAGLVSPIFRPMTRAPAAI